MKNINGEMDGQNERGQTYGHDDSIKSHNKLILWSKHIKLKKETSKTKKKLSNINFKILGALFFFLS